MLTLIFSIYTPLKIIHSFRFHSFQSKFRRKSLVSLDPNDSSLLNHGLYVIEFFVQPVLAVVSVQQTGMV